MSRRARAGGFLLVAALCAVAAATVANGYGERVARGYGQLRPVVVASEALPAGKSIGPEDAVGKLEVRRVPVRFAPPGVLGAPAQAVGLEPVGTVPAGAYVLAGQLRSPSSSRSPLRLGHGRRPVEIEVGGAGALAAMGPPLGGSLVDVVVTTEPSGSAGGRTYVAAPAVPLLALAPSAEAGSATTTATLGLTRPQALRLIAAESFARRITVIPR
ncbi:MAG TPA: SAF domain-containing protein [Solirubrobacterales bacterium]|nr:SAF domain-containing protein [Solirubrobacterales bacterium]